jgi:hypothetical protein
MLNPPNRPRQPRSDPMPAQHRHQLLDQALRLSRRMGELGAEGQWQQVIELESTRSALLEQAFARRAPADEVTARQIHAILAADKQLMSLGVEARDEAAAELAQMQRGRKCQQAYRSIGA